ncbi:hypothetical protein GCM10010372_52790 [Streptomyces tauricus]|nr:hypothetical protein GCM10010372_52790 [Streptomyces tauricus]
MNMSRPSKSTASQQSPRTRRAILLPRADRAKEEEEGDIVVPLVQESGAWRGFGRWVARDSCG